MSTLTYDKLNSKKFIESRAFVACISMFLVMIWSVGGIFRIFLGSGVRCHLKREDIMSDANFIIAANHGSFFDPIVITNGVRFSAFLNLLPLRTFVFNRLFDSLLRPFILLAGCFPAREHRTYPYGLGLASHLLSKHQTICIFPEGKRNLDGTAKPHSGVAVLANTPGTLLIPAKIAWRKRLLGLPAYSLVIGRPIDATQMTAEQIMSHIQALD